MDKLNVLIIDDSKQVADAFRDVLHMIGFQCEIVLNAKDALARLSALTPDLILLDMRLGQEIGGDDILHQIRSNPRFDQTRVIVITAYPEVAKLVSDLADLILLKPVDIDQLVTLTQRLSTFEVKPKTFPFRDPVTQLYNKEFFHTRMEHAFARAKRRKDFVFAAIIINLSPLGGESQIPAETWNNLLQQVAERLRSQLRVTDTIARFKGWKFAVLVEEMKEVDDLKIILQRLETSLSKPYMINGNLYRLASSFGIAMNDRTYTRLEDMIDLAEQSRLPGS